MNVTPIPVNRDQVRQQLRAVRQRLHKDADREYAELEKRLSQIGDAKQLLDVREPILSAPVDARGRPRLAIARADRKVVQVRARETRIVFSTEERFGSFRSLSEEFNRATPAKGLFVDGWSRVPLVPASIRNQTKGQLREYHILWEVDQWHDRHPDRVDRDPILLRRIGDTGSLFAVIAQWDLTDLEMLLLNSIPTRR